jgi:hypothetical protein
VLNYCATFDWDFPVGVDVGGQIFTAWNTDRHNYFVIDREGIIRYRATQSYGSSAAWSTYLPQIRTAINNALEVAVEPTTWSRVKSLLR